MPIIIVKEKKYIHADSVSNLINYIMDPQKSFYGLASGVGVDLFDEYSMINHFNLVKRVWHKEEADRKAGHIIVSFDPYMEDDIDPDDAFKIAFYIAQYFGRRFQTVFAIHDESYCRKTGALHIHFVINSVSYIDGNMFPSKRTIFFELLKQLNNLNQLNWRLIFDYKQLKQ